MSQNKKNIKIYSLFALFIFCILIAGCGQKGVGGKVTDPDGSPLDNVVVKIEKSNFEATTNKKGEYIIDYAPGSFKIIFSKDNYSSYDLELNLSNKSLFPAQTIILYPIYSENELYDIKNKRYKRLSPKDEWEIIKRIKFIQQISNGSIELKKDLPKDLLFSLFPFIPIENIEEKHLEIMSKQIKDYIEILEIDKIVEISIYDGGIEVEVRVQAKNKNLQGTSEIKLVKQDRLGNNWFLKHIGNISGMDLNAKKCQDAQNELMVLMTTIGTSLPESGRAVLRRLIEGCGNPNLRVGNCYSLLSIAASSDFVDVMELLLARGADINGKGDDGTPLHWAIVAGKHSAALLLIKKGADVNLPKSGGWRPLDVAIDHMDEKDPRTKEVISALLEKGAKRK